MGKEITLTQVVTQPRVTRHILPLPQPKESISSQSQTVSPQSLDYQMNRNPSFTFRRDLFITDQLPFMKERAPQAARSKVIIIGRNDILKLRSIRDEMERALVWLVSRVG